MLQLASLFAKVIPANQLVYSRLPSSLDKRVFGFYSAFWVAILDWHTTCLHYDEHMQEWQTYQPQLDDYFGPGTGQMTPEQSDFLIRWGNLNNELRYDIRCFYIFADVAHRAFTQTIKALHKKHAKRGMRSKIAAEYTSRFKADNHWFKHNVEIYRDKFIEHPRSVGVPTGITSDRSGVRLAGVTPLSREDEKQISQIADETKEALPDLAASPTALFKYLYLCEHMEMIPSRQLGRFIEMIQRVGLQSGNLEPLAIRLCTMYTNMILFFAEHNQ
jgi:hypothetical protein